MYLYRLTDEAQHDIVGILAYTASNFGWGMRRRYQATIVAALREISRDPARRGVMTRVEFPCMAMTYHLRHVSRLNNADLEPVRNPRHLLVFRFDGRERLVVLRVLHESMDISRHMDNDN